MEAAETAGGEPSLGEQPLDHRRHEDRVRHAAIHGVRWFPSRPPVIGLEYEMDLRGVAREVLV